MDRVTPAATIIHGGRIATLDPGRPFVSALAIANRRVLAVGDLERLSQHRADTTVTASTKASTAASSPSQRTTRARRASEAFLMYNMELRWDGVPSLAEALRMLKRQAERTPRRSGYASLVAGPSFSS